MRSTRLGGAFAALGCLAALSCGSSPLPAASSGKAASDGTPASFSGSYSSEPRPDGVGGGAEAGAIGAEIASALGQRGDVAQADGALGAVAGWFMSQVNAGHPPSSTACERMTRQLGYVGTIVLAAAFDREHPETSGWRESLAALPRNMPVNRFGVWSAPDGPAAAVVFGAVEATLQPFPRHVEAGGKLRLQGQVGPRFSASRIYVTRPDGTVSRSSSGAREFDATMTLAESGVHQVEVMGDGATGPVVVVNVPVFVGALEADQEQARSPSVTDPPAVEARVLLLMNQARARLGLGPLAPDDELRRLALAHDEDMTRNHFFGHVSPTTGTLDDRVRRAGLRAVTAGENVAQAPDADAAYDHLMGSPAHRANMVHPRYTHVGIAAVADAPSGNVLVTLVFARRAPVLAAAPTPAELQQRAQAFRRSKGLGAVQVEPSLQASAEAGARALAGGATPEAALEASGAELRRTSRQRAGSSAQICTQLAELHELEDLEQRPFLASPALRQLGMAVALTAEAGSQRLWLLSVYTGPRCKE